MRHTDLPLNNVAVVFGGTVVHHIETGAVLSELVLMTNLGNAQLLQAQVKLNSDVIYDLTGEELRMLEHYKNQNTTLPDGVFVITFDDITAITEDGQNLSGLVTHPEDNLTLTIKLAQATAQQVTDSVVPEVKGFIRQRARHTKGGELERRRFVPRKSVIDIDASATGVNNYNTFSKGPRIQRMHFASTNISSLEIKHNGITRFDRTLAENELMLMRYGRKKQTGYFHFDAVATGFNLMDSLQTAGRKFEIKPTVTQAGNIPVLIESLEAAA